MKKKYYAVKAGRKIGIYDTWKECEEQIKGFSNAQYKSFLRIEEAKNFLTDNKLINKNNEEITCEENTLIAYVDGSYDKITKCYGSGIYIENDEKVYLKFKGNDEKFSESWNVAGELIAVMEAINYAIKNNYDKINIYDYEGIEKWADGTWNANKYASKTYKEFIEPIKEKIKLNFIKVKAHSGNKGNEIADKLAKEALNK